MIGANRRPIDKRIVLSQNPIVFFCLGQSNAANTGEALYSPKRPVYCFNPFNSKFYNCDDPLPGATGSGGSPWGRLGDTILLNRPDISSVCFVSIAVGGSFINEWAPAGVYSRRLDFAIERLLRVGLTVNFILWCQGEAEANLTSLTRHSYIACFHEMLGNIRLRGINAPVYVAKSTLCETAIHPYKNRDEIRGALEDLVGSNLGILRGPDTDSIGLDGRSDGCHFNETGLSIASRLWFESVNNNLSSPKPANNLNKEFFMLKNIARGLFHYLGYTVMKNRNYEKLLQSNEITNDSGAINSSSPVTEQQTQVHPDYQLLMAQQSIMAGFDDLDAGFRPIMEFVKPFTMTSLERMYDLYKSVEYIVKAQVPGDILECGVWRGGSMMLVAKALVAFGDTSRTLYLFDTFEGHPKPDYDLDVDMWGNRAVNEWVNFRKTDETSNWAYVSLDEVKENMLSTGYPSDKIVYVKGMIENTAKEQDIKVISLVRLDTDWYASAKAGLENFEPRISVGGVLIMDDYGHYVGQRKATDEYFQHNPVLLHRIDYSCRTVIKVSKN